MCGLTVDDGELSQWPCHGETTINIVIIIIITSAEDGVMFSGLSVCLSVR